MQQNNNQLEKNKQYVLGLDIGIASVGAAVLAQDSLLGIHIRTFEKAETADKGKSLNSIRKGAKSLRVRLRRRTFRLLRLCRLMKREGLINEAKPQVFHNVQSWQLRAQGLDRLLQPNEWAAVLYHINKHRGYHSTRKSESAKKDSDTGAILSGVAHNKQQLKELGCRTIGELLAKQAQQRNRGGSYERTIGREDLEHELRTLFETQRQCGNPHTSSDFEQQVLTLLMARRPAITQEQLEKMVGKCTLESNEPRAPKASYRAERFVWLGKLNHLKICSQGKERDLTEQERQNLIDFPFIKTKITFTQIRKELDLNEKESINFVRVKRGETLEKAESVTLFEAKVFHALRKGYEKAGLKTEWSRDAANPDRLDDIAHALTTCKEDAEIRAQLHKKGVDEKIIEAVLELSFDQFINLSQKALIKILPFMEQGLRYDEACKEAGYHHSQTNTGEKTKYLAKPNKEEIRNPVVYRALNQACKLVNGIIKKYGSPQAIHIELARDLTRNFADRQKIEREQTKNRAVNEQAKAELQSQFGFEAKGFDLLKQKLYREQQSQCPYCAKELDHDQVFPMNRRDVSYAQVDHILPESRTWDDSYLNKVLVHSACNQNKGNRTPFETWGNTERWRVIEAWVNSSKSILGKKRDKILRESLTKEDTEGFRDRHLNDTRYITKAFKAMLETLQLTDDVNKRIVVVAGHMTERLRARWGLHKVREESDLHHGLDACVIAATSHTMVQRMADYAKRRELKHMELSEYTDPATGEILNKDEVDALESSFPKPYPGFDLEVFDKLRKVRVSRMPTRRGLGSAHAETIRSIGKEGKYIKEQQSAVKTSLTKLTLKNLENIVGYDDPRNQGLIKALRERLEQHNDDAIKAFATPFRKPNSKGEQNETCPVVRSVNVFGTQKSGLHIKRGEGEAIVDNGDMLRVDVFTDGKKFYGVPIYVANAVKAELPNKAVSAGKPESEWDEMTDKHQFLFSLYKNDWVRVTDKSGVKEGFYTGLDRATGAISFWRHDRNTTIVKDGLYRGVGIKTAKSVEKFHVDVLGNLYPSPPETRQPIHRKNKTSGGKV